MDGSVIKCEMILLAFLPVTQVVVWEGDFVDGLEAMAPGRNLSQ